MALVRPPKGKASLTPDLVQEPTLSQVLSALNTLSGQVRDLRTVLMGDGDAGETPHGRIPKLEKDVEGHETRLKILEAANITAAAYWNSGRIVGHILTALLGGAATVIVEKIVLHIR